MKYYDKKISELLTEIYETFHILPREKQERFVTFLEERTQLFRERLLEWDAPNGQAAREMGGTGVPQR